MAPSPQDEAAAAAAAEAAAKRKAEEEARLALVQRKYGLGAEAARRLVPADRDAAAAGVLLRDVCSALLRLATGKPGAAKGEQPRAGKLQSEENEVGGWAAGEAAPGGWDPAGCGACSRGMQGSAPERGPRGTCRPRRGRLTRASPSPPPPLPAAAAEPAALAGARVQRGVGLGRVGCGGPHSRHQAGLRRLPRPVARGARAGEAFTAWAAPPSLPGQLQPVEAAPRPASPRHACCCSDGQCVQPRRRCS